jgi:hypothetical protein
MATFFRSWSFINKKNSSPASPVPVFFRVIALALAWRAYFAYEKKLPNGEKFYREIIDCLFSVKNVTLIFVPCFYLRIRLFFFFGWKDPDNENFGKKNHFDKNLLLKKILAKCCMVLKNLGTLIFFQN